MVLAGVSQAQIPACPSGVQLCVEALSGELAFGLGSPLWLRARCWGRWALAQAEISVFRKPCQASPREETKVSAPRGGASFSQQPRGHCQAEGRGGGPGTGKHHHQGKTAVYQNILF